MHNQGVSGYENLCIAMSFSLLAWSFCACVMVSFSLRHVSCFFLGSVSSCEYLWWVPHLRIILHGTLKCRPPPARTLCILPMICWLFWGLAMLMEHQSTAWSSSHAHSCTKEQLGHMCVDLHAVLRCLLKVLLYLGKGGKQVQVVYIIR